MGDSFVAGVMPGGLTEGKDIRVLICHMLSSVSEGMSLEEMSDIFFRDGIMNYFEFTDAVAELMGSGCIEKSVSESGVPLYTVTEKGRQASVALSGKLPYSIVEKTESRASEKVKMRRTATENLALVTKTCDGYNVKLTVSDIGTNLMELSLFLPTEEEAENVKKNFLRDPEGTYMKLLSELVDL